MRPSDDTRMRRATTQDAEAVAAILNESILKRDATMLGDPVSAMEMARRIGGLHEKETILILEEGGVVRGWGIVRFYSDRLGYARTCETSVFVRREHTGRGLGSRIQRALLEAARTADFHHVVARIWTANQRSIAMHAKLGFTVVGTQRDVGYMDGSWIDVTIMQCLLETER